MRVLRTQDFLEGATDTGFLDRFDLGDLSAPLTQDHRLHALAASMAGQAARRRNAPVLGSIPSGWRNAPSQLNVQAWESPAGRIEIGYRFGRDGLIAEIDGSPVQAELHDAAPDQVDMSADGIRRRYRVQRVDRHMWVSSPLGQSELVQVGRFVPPEAAEAPGSLRSPMPGKVVELAVTEGATVAPGDVVVIIEAMKMEHAVRAPADGTVASIRVAVGDQVESDQLLAVVEAAEDE